MRSRADPAGYKTLLRRTTGFNSVPSALQEKKSAASTRFESSFCHPGWPSNRILRHLSQIHVAAEKTHSLENGPKKFALGSPTNDSLNFLDIFIPEILVVWEETGIFQHPLTCSLVSELFTLGITSPTTTHLGPY